MVRCIRHDKGLSDFNDVNVGPLYLLRVLSVSAGRRVGSSARVVYILVIIYYIKQIVDIL